MSTLQEKLLAMAHDITERVSEAQHVTVPDIAPEFLQPLSFLILWGLSTVFGYRLLSAANEEVPERWRLPIGIIGIALVGSFPLIGLYFMVGSFL